MQNQDFIIVVPSRQGSTRLPNKPLANIGHCTMIEHLISSLKLKFSQQIYVATDSKEIVDVVRGHGIKYIMTGKCPSGTDRVYEAFSKIPDKKNIRYVINLQGDMPFINPEVITQILARLRKEDCDIATSIVKVDQEVAASNSNVKVVLDQNNNAMYFSRLPIPYGGKEFNYHIGVYGFTVDALERFVTLKQSCYELSENLEQLRALESGMKIGVVFSDQVPISVDTQEDLDQAILYYNRYKK
ncbi:MAG TPA: 3-deoxy-manno-octulosonate cytidylyltransferase [Candidatus Megaira endosymbiont of Nemacystus decipiens]|nr:3-deoxy-manno-octulosonate cytidylyltransferase [Candidatus Megaera endosymbiont of Nemacystus decipiens]